MEAEERNALLLKSFKKEAERKRAEEAKLAAERLLAVQKQLKEMEIRMKGEKERVKQKDGHEQELEQEHVQQEDIALLYFQF